MRQDSINLHEKTTKAEMRKQLEGLQASHDRLWVMKERYKTLWMASEEKLDCIYKDLEQFMEGIK